MLPRNSWVVTFARLMVKSSPTVSLLWVFNSLKILSHKDVDKLYFNGQDNTNEMLKIHYYNITHKVTENNDQATKSFPQFKIYLLSKDSREHSWK